MTLATTGSEILVLNGFLLFVCHLLYPWTGSRQRHILEQPIFNKITWDNKILLIKKATVRLVKGVRVNT